MGDCQTLRSRWKRGGEFYNLRKEILAACAGPTVDAGDLFAMFPGFSSGIKDCRGFDFSEITGKIQKEFQDEFGRKLCLGLPVQITGSVNGVDFSYAVFRYVDFHSIEMSECKFKDVLFRECAFDAGSKFTCVEFSRCSFDRPWGVVYSDFKKCEFSHMTLVVRKNDVPELVLGGRFDSCKITNLQFRKMILRLYPNVVFNSCVFDGVLSMLEFDEPHSYSWRWFCFDLASICEFLGFAKGIGRFPRSVGETSFEELVVGAIEVPIFTVLSDSFKKRSYVKRVIKLPIKTLLRGWLEFRPSVRYVFDDGLMVSKSQYIADLV